MEHLNRAVANPQKRPAKWLLIGVAMSLLWIVLWIAFTIARSHVDCNAPDPGDFCGYGADVYFGTTAAFLVLVPAWMAIISFHIIKASAMSNRKFYRYSRPLWLVFMIFNVISALATLAWLLLTTAS